MAGWKAAAIAERNGVRAQIEVNGDAFMASLRRAVEGLVVNTEDDLWRLALTTQNLARAYAPVDTGRLRSSIQASKGRDGAGFFADIGTNVEYAAYVEFGTRYQSAQPYLRPALAVAAAAWTASVGRSVG